MGWFVGLVFFSLAAKDLIVQSPARAAGSTWLRTSGSFASVFTRCFTSLTPTPEQGRSPQRRRGHRRPAGNRGERLRPFAPCGEEAPSKTSTSWVGFLSQPTPPQWHWGSVPSGWRWAEEGQGFLQPCWDFPRQDSPCGWEHTSGVWGRIAPVRVVYGASSPLLAQPGPWEAVNLCNFSPTDDTCGTALLTRDLPLPEPWRRLKSIGSTIWPFTAMREEVVTMESC